MEIKQSQIFSHWTCPNLSLFCIGRKLLEYFVNFYYWHLSISSQKCAQTIKLKQNKN